MTATQRYEAAIAKLFALQTRGVRMGVDRMRAALRYRGFDAEAMPYVIVAGTNGKGSVSAMLASVLREAGHRTGLFTSPHLHRFTERVRIDGRPIGIAEAARRIEDVLAAFAQPGAPEVTFFELSTLLAVETFRDHGCDLAVLEVGLGGRLDATNAFPAKLSVITRIAFDHQEYLGNTLAKIAAEKAGVIKRGAPVVTGVREPEALRVIAARARRMGAKLRVIDRDFEPPRAGEKLALGLRGEHQRDNAACAIEALEQLRGLGVRMPRGAVQRGLARVRWPARLERIAGRPSFLLDAAHNPDGAQALARHLDASPRKRRVLVFGVMRDKDYAAMLATLAPRFDRIVYAAPALPRAATPAELARVQPGARARSVADAIARAKRLAGRSGSVVVAGSIFLVAEARARLLHVPSDPLIRS
ncbi:MAG TPA: folylpolyglutamate synthase/dihydrofolate synthase family protein [Polyangiales bacterium]|nr:folylpolyglutamate synthase/dihydrofolate synthase family protein [Polyangiales bacterium]